MPNLARQHITTADPIVVKVGTRVLACADGRLDLERVASISRQLVEMADSGRHVVLVSSGAVGAGIGRLGLSARPTDLAQLQAIAAIGQSRLIEAYQQALELHGRHAAQILLTADDLNDRTRYLNVRNTIFALFRYGAIPIINENDTVRVDELQRNVGDNDRLAAMVTNLIRAPLLILLSDVAGLYDGDPAAPGSQIISEVHDVDAALNALNGNLPATTPNQLSKGGIRSKLGAAKMVTSAGENAVIADGRQDDVLARILTGDVVGTLFPAPGPSIASRKRWIGLTVNPCGRLTLDAGATKAIVQHRRSLLAVGVTNVDGDFQKGDVVALCDKDGRELGRGLINYDVDEMRKIAGRPTGEIVQLLGHLPYEEVVHRDNLVTFVRS